MFDLHSDRDGNKIPIAAMDDVHLMNTVKMICRKLHSFVGQTTPVDPQLAILYGLKPRSPEEVAGQVRGLSKTLYPYLAEALLRGGNVAATCTEEVQTTFARKGAIPWGDNVAALKLSFVVGKPAIP